MTLPTLVIQKDTWGKDAPVQQKALRNSQKVELSAGQRLSVMAWSYAPGGHLQVYLKEPLASADGTCTSRDWFVFDDHVDLLVDGKPIVTQEIQLKAPYYSQRDNREEWWRTCNTSSHAMLLNFIKPWAVQSDDDYFQKYVKGIGDSTDWEVHTHALAVNKIRSTFRTDLSYQHLDASLALGIPVPIGVMHKGTLASPAGGHVILVIGRYDGGYICHDPWGEGFDYTNHNGAAVRYPLTSLDRRWEPGHGYGRLITEFNGRKTGL